MQAYVDTVLYPSTASIVGAADKYVRKTSVFRSNGSFTLKSSADKGHALAVLYVQAATNSGGTLYNWFEDSATPTLLDVTNMPTIATLTAHATGAGTVFSTYYSFTRVVSFDVTFTYIGNELNGSGEASIGSDNGTIITIANNIPAIIQDMSFNCHDRAEHTFRQIWLPQDDSDFILHAPNTPEKATTYGAIYFAATGLPKATEVYQVNYCAVIEGIPLTLNLDFIPRSMSVPLDVEGALLLLKTKIYNDPRLVCSSGDKCHDRYMRQGIMPGVA